MTETQTCVGISGAVRICPTTALEILLFLNTLNMVVKTKVLEAMIRVMIDKSNMTFPREFLGLKNRLASSSIFN